MAYDSEPLISLKEAAGMLGLDLNAVRRLTVKRKGLRLKSLKVSERRRHTKKSWVQEYINAMNPLAAELEAVRLIDPRKEARIDRDLAARGCLGAQAKREVLGVRKGR